MRKSLNILSKIKRPFNDNTATSSSEPTYHKVTADEVRDLNALIRLRYRLDHEIWDQRYCTKAARVGVREKMERADAVLAKLKKKVSEWDHRECWDSIEDWMKLQDIRGRLELNGKRVSTPWEEVKYKPEERIVDRHVNRLIELA